MVPTPPVPARCVRNPLLFCILHSASITMRHPERGYVQAALSIIPPHDSHYSFTLLFTCLLFVPFSSFAPLICSLITLPSSSLVPALPARISSCALHYSPSTTTRSRSHPQVSAIEPKTVLVGGSLRAEAQLSGGSLSVGHIATPVLGANSSDPISLAGTVMGRRAISFGGGVTLVSGPATPGTPVTPVTPGGGGAVGSFPAANGTASSSSATNSSGSGGGGGRRRMAPGEGHCSIHTHTVTATHITHTPMIPRRNHDAGPHMIRTCVFPF
jgi:hypothetical protein